MLGFEKTSQGEPDVLSRFAVCCGFAKTPLSTACGKVYSAEPRLRLSRHEGGCCWAVSLLAVAAGEVILGQGREQPGLALLSQKIPCTPPFPCLCSRPFPKPSFPWVRFLPVSSFIDSYPTLLSIELTFCFFCLDTHKHQAQTTK